MLQYVEKKSFNTSDYPTEKVYSFVEMKIRNEAIRTL